MGLELLGATGPLADAEVLELAFAALEALGVEGEVEVGLPSLVGEVLKASSFRRPCKGGRSRPSTAKTSPSSRGFSRKAPSPRRRGRSSSPSPTSMGSGRS